MKKLLLFATLGLATLPARAQWNPTDAIMSTNSYSSGWVNPYNNTMSNIYQSNMNLITQQAIQRSQLFSYNVGSGAFNGTTRRRKRLASLKATERAAAARFEKYRGTMFKDSGRATIPAKLAAIFAKSAGANAKEIEPVFKVLLDVYKTRAKQQNAPPNDLARTLAYAIAANYYIFAGKQGVPEPQIAALRAKIRTALSEDAKFRALKDADKQQWSETLIILAHFNAWGAEDLAEKAPKDKKAAVRDGFRKLAGVSLQGILGVDPKQVSFDNSGLVIKAA